MLGETLASTYPVVPAAIARRGVPADSRTRRDVCFNISRRPHATVRRGVPADSRIRRDVGTSTYPVVPTPSLAGASRLTRALGETRALQHIPSSLRHRPPGVPAHSRTRRDAGTSTSPIVPTPSPAGVSRLTRALGEARALQHLPSSLRHRPPGRPGSLAHSAGRGHFNISHRPYAIARRGVPAHSRTRRDAGTSTYPIVPTPSPAGASRPSRQNWDIRAKRSVWFA